MIWTFSSGLRIGVWSVVSPVFAVCISLLSRRVALELGSKWQPGPESSPYLRTLIFEGLFAQRLSRNFTQCVSSRPVLPLGFAHTKPALPVTTIPIFKSSTANRSWSLADAPELRPVGELEPPGATVSPLPDVDVPPAIDFDS